jgi:hypothetical protein
LIGDRVGEKVDELVGGVAVGFGLVCQWQLAARALHPILYLDTSISLYVRSRVLLLVQPFNIRYQRQQS